MPTFRLDIPSGASSYVYQTDVIRVQWQEDRSDYRILDNSVSTDVRAKLPIISIETVLVSENTNADGISATDLYELIQAEVRAGNSVDFIPDPTASAPNSSTPSVGVVTAPDGQPEAYRVERGADRLRRSLKLRGDTWLDPSVTADKDLIDDLNSLSDPL